MNVVTVHCFEVTGRPFFYSWPLFQQEVPWLSKSILQDLTNLPNMFSNINLWPWEKALLFFLNMEILSYSLHCDLLMVTSFILQKVIWPIVLNKTLKHWKLWSLFCCLFDNISRIFFISKYISVYRVYG